MTTFITTPAQAAAMVAEALGINADDRISVEVTDNGWDTARCEETGAPGEVDVTWVTRDGDTTDRTLAGDIAGDHINVLLMSEDVDAYETIYVKVARAYVRPQLADVTDWVEMPTRIAA